MSQLLTWLSALAWQCPSLHSPAFLTPSPVPLITSVLVSQPLRPVTEGFGNTIIFLYTFLFFIVSLYVSTCVQVCMPWRWQLMLGVFLSQHPPWGFRDSICPWTWSSPFQLRLPSQQTPRMCCPCTPALDSCWNPESTLLHLTCMFAGS